MNEPIVPLFVPPRTTPPATRGTSRLPLPRPIIPPTPTEMIVSIARLDHSGRVPAADQITALGWKTGDHTSTSHTGSAITVHHVPQDTPRMSTAAIDSRKQILIPGAERAHFTIRTTDKLILIAMPDRDVIITFPVATLETLLTRHLVESQQPGTNQR